MSLNFETLSQPAASMPLDTVKLRSPPIDPGAYAEIERRCVRKQAIEVASGHILYQITSGALRGSWDSRISLRPMREEWRQDSNGHMRLCTALPYVLVECSAAKMLYGQNIYGGPVDFISTCSQIVQLLEDHLGVRLPATAQWIVRRADWAETFALPFIAIQEYFRRIQATHFPRRKVRKYGDHAIYIPGSTTTLKLYHKGVEFKAHDRARLQKLHLNLPERPSHKSSRLQSRRFPNRSLLKIRALQRLANNRMRVEVEIHADKLDFDFGRKPRVEDVTPQYLMRVFDYEIDRFLREGQDSLQLARTNLAVSDCLRTTYGETAGNRLHAFWCQLAACGEGDCRSKYAPATSYRNRRLLQRAGVSWHNTDVQVIEPRQLLPPDFAPVRLGPRRCTSRIRAANVPSYRQFNVEVFS